jgi:anti-sigma regulatory factor (Ser/Thr protein kinase)
VARHSLHLRVPADAASLSGHTRRVRAFLVERGVEHGTADDLRLCVHECCANAMRHSGSSDDIDVWLSVDEDEVAILIKDYGRGLDLERCDPGRSPEPHSTCGRGLYVVTRLLDEFEITVDGGTEIRMTKRLPRPTA